MAKAPSKTDQKALEEHSETDEVLDWKVVAETWIGPHFKKVGTVVQLTEAQAAYYVPHILSPKAGSSAAAPADAATD